MNKHQTQIDRRPFRSKADHESELALQQHYQRLAIPAVVAAVQQSGSEDKDRLDEQAA